MGTYEKKQPESLYKRSALIVIIAHREEKDLFRSLRYGAVLHTS